MRDVHRAQKMKPNVHKNRQKRTAQKLEMLHTYFRSQKSTTAAPKPSSNDLGVKKSQGVVEHASLAAPVVTEAELAEPALVVQEHLHEVSDDHA